MLFIGLAVLYFVAVFFFRNKIALGSNKVKQNKAVLSPMISEFLFYEEDASKKEKTKYVNLKIEIRQLIKNEFSRKVLAGILLDLRKDVSGDTQRRLFKLYTDFGLHNDAFESLKSWRWEIVSKGILELTQMQVQESYGFITKFINDKRSTIRKQAEIATVTLKSEGINYFLDTTTSKISEWQQLKLLDVIRNKEDFRPPLFKVWLTSKNKHVVLFALRLIKYYHQNDAKASLVELVKHRNNQIKEEAIHCVKEFNIIEALDTLQVVFWKSPTNIKISVLDTIAYIGNKGHIPFLQSIENKETNFLVKSKAIAAINTISPESIMPTVDIQDIRNYKTPDDIVSKKEEARSLVDNDIDELDITDKAPVKEPLLDGGRGIEENPEDSKALVKESFDIPRPEVSFENLAKKRKEELPINMDFIPLVIDATAVKTDGPEKEQRPIKEKTNTEMDAPSIASKDQQNQDTFNFEMSDVDFIPLVIDTTAVEIDGPEKEQRPIKEKTNTEMDAPSTASKDQQNQDTSKFEMSDMDFIPLVVTEENEEQENKTFYEDITYARFKEEYDKVDAEVDELDFLPLVTHNDLDQGHSPIEHINEQQTVLKEDMDYGTLLDFDIAQETEALAVENTGEEQENNQDGLEPPIANEEPEEQDVVSWLLAANGLRELEVTYEEVIVEDPISDLIPKPVYYNEYESYMMALLDDLEELGDYREIPLLKAYKDQEEVLFVQERIGQLIDSFSVDKDPSTAVDFKPKTLDIFPIFNVFENLFQYCDTEKKLILMDEVIAVGDEKEIEFLKRLLADKEPKIRIKASLVLEGLQNKLSGKTEPLQEDVTVEEDDFIAQLSKKEVTVSSSDISFDVEGSSSDANDIFDMNFELCEEFDGVNELVARKTIGIASENKRSLLNPFGSIPDKMMQKFNE